MKNVNDNMLEKEITPLNRIYTKLINAGFVNSTDEEFVKDDWTIRFYGDQVEAYDSALYYKQDWEKLDFDVLIAEINMFMKDGK